MNMKKYVGKKWRQLTIVQQEELLKHANVWNNIKAGECIVDFSEGLSVSANIIDEEIVINDNAILYNPTEGVL